MGRPKPHSAAGSGSHARSSSGEMMHRFFIVILAFTLVASCSQTSDLTPAATLAPATVSVEASLPASDPTRALPTSAEVEAGVATKAPRPTLAPDDWKTLPAIPTGISDAM